MIGIELNCCIPHAGTICSAPCYDNKSSTAPAGNNVTEEEKGILTEVNEKLREIYSEFYKRMPNKEGIVLRPQANDRLSTCDGGFGRQKLFLGAHHCHLGGT